MKKNSFWGKKQFNKREEEEKSTDKTEEEYESDWTPEDDDDSEGNRIYLYEEISRSTSKRISKSLKKAQASILWLKAKFDNIQEMPIYLHINSGGGYLTDSFAIANMIKRSPIPVHTIIEGEACSGATIISMSGAKRLIREDSLMLIHQLSGAFWGTYENIKDDMKNADLEMNMLYKFYSNHCNIKAKELKEILKHDLFFTAEKCLELNMVDEII